MTYRKTYEVKKNNQLIINLPDQFRMKRKVIVIIKDIDDEQDEKIDLIKKASKDPLFLEDLSEISSDFVSIDKESL